MTIQGEALNIYCGLIDTGCEKQILSFDPKNVLPQNCNFVWRERYVTPQLSADINETV